MKTSHTKEPRGQPFPSRWPQGCKEQTRQHDRLETSLRDIMFKVQFEMLWIDITLIKIWLVFVLNETSKAKYFRSYNPIWSMPVIISERYNNSSQISFLYRGSYMSAHVLLNLLNELGKRDKMRGLPSILSLFRNEFNKFNNTRARMLDSIYHMTLRLLWNLISGVKSYNCVIMYATLLRTS